MQMLIKYSRLILFVLLSMPVLSVNAQPAEWLTYSDPIAGYAFDYPTTAHLSAGLDATQGYNSVFVTLNDERTYQGYSIVVFDNTDDLPLDRFLIERRGLDASAGQSVQVGRREALRAAQHTGLAGVDADVYWVDADRVVIRLGLYAGEDGSVEPSPVARAAFDRAITSFRLIPRSSPVASTPVPARPSASAARASAVAEQFQSPFNVPTTTAYETQWNVLTNDTRYGVRNLSLSGRKCFGVAWNRMLHSGIDLYRLDGADAANTPVVAVADGWVAYYDPSYASYPGKVVILGHLLSDGRTLYSMYGHLGSVSVAQGQPVVRGQTVGTILYQPGDSHLHFEMRRFLDGHAIYPSYTSCNGSAAFYYGRGYTYLIHPNDFPAADNGYVDPDRFIQSHGGWSLTPFGVPDAYLPKATLQTASADITVLAGTQSIALGDKSPADAPRMTIEQFPVIAQPAWPAWAQSRLSALPQKSDRAAASLLTAADPITYTVFLPLVMRPVPRLEPACVEGQELLTNNGFELGPGSAPWVQVSNGSADLIEGQRPYSGGYGLWLGGRNTADEEVLQSFVLPYYTQGVTLTFKRLLTTNEMQPQVFDHFEIVVENNVGNEITPQLSFSNLSQNRDLWVAEDAVFSGFEAWGNKRLRLSTKGMTDGSVATSFFVDDVSLQTHCAP